MKHFLITTIFTMACAIGVNAQVPASEGGEDGGHVQYVLILPDEKNPENVKAEENNPFEVASDGTEDQGTTEEKQVSDAIMTMPFQGLSSGGPNGLIVMLGGMRLAAGMDVPPVLPDQQVALKVKSVSPQAVELVWVEKKPSGLPPKLLVIPIDAAPKIRYRMPNGGGGLGTMRPGSAAASAGGAGTGAPQAAASKPGDSAAPLMAEKEGGQGNAPAKPDTGTKPAPPPSNTPEASVLRMLFGNHAQPGK